MNAIASSISGGTMLTGGVGNIIGTFFGVLSLSTIQNIVSSAGLDQAWWTELRSPPMLPVPCGTEYCNVQKEEAV